jgi:4-hydroxythreonine-4-phosphate dehydrogenase
MKPAIRIGITAGDINGIGPEVALKAVAQHPWPANVRFIFYGPAAILREQARRLRIAPPETCDTTENKLRWQPGKITAAAGREAIAAIRAAVEDAQSGVLHGIVTAPISKEGIHLAGLKVPGHTEFLAQLTGTKRFAMMLFGGPLRVVLATRHIPLCDVPKKLTPALLREQIELTAEALPWLGAKKARVAVCGLNPHAGEGGDIGREEITIIAPVIRELAKKGLNVSGPWPGDTIFHAAARGDFDAVVAMYHDQGLAPLKLIAFDTGVNVTLGLPLVRTSPDHGTAYAIAGKNRANPASMIEAIRWAITLATRKNPWR